MIGQIRDRREIYRQNIDELDQGICEAQNAVHRQVSDAGVTMANQSQQDSVEKAIQVIYEQKRTERVNLWRDESRIRTNLPESAQMYLSATRKMAILDDSPGDVR